MSKPVPIMRLDRSAIDLRREASRCSNGAVVRRLLAIALVLEGRPRTEAAEACGMDRQTLRDWVHHYNDEGTATHDRGGSANAPTSLILSLLFSDDEQVYVPTGIASTDNAAAGANYAGSNLDRVNLPHIHQGSPRHST